jgi:hypothetical protein
MNQGGPAPTDDEPLTYARLADSFDRVLENEQFRTTSHLSIQPAGGDMMGMAMYGGIPNMMPGQVMQQFPMVPTPAQQITPDQLQQIQQPVQESPVEENQDIVQEKEPEVVPEAEQEVEETLESSALYQSIPNDNTGVEPQVER